MEKVDFTEKDVKAYVDKCIRFWRDKRDKAELEHDEEEILVTRCYVDAYQSMRTSIFGELLPIERSK